MEKHSAVWGLEFEGPQKKEGTFKKLLLHSDCVC